MDYGKLGDLHLHLASGKIAERLPLVSRRLRPFLVFVRLTFSLDLCRNPVVRRLPIECLSLARSRLVISASNHSPFLSLRNRRESRSDSGQLDPLTCASRWCRPFWIAATALSVALPNSSNASRNIPIRRFISMLSTLKICRTWSAIPPGQPALSFGTRCRAFPGHIFSAIFGGSWPTICSVGGTKKLAVSSSIYSIRSEERRV